MILDVEVSEIKKEKFFSLNIDEVTNDANHVKVLTSLVGYFLPQKSNLVVRLCKRITSN